VNSNEQETRTPQGPEKERVTIYLLKPTAVALNKRADAKNETLPEYTARNLNASAVEKS
jgi:hypothetical protein